MLPTHVFIYLKIPIRFCSRNCKRLMCTTNIVCVCVVSKSQTHKNIVPNTQYTSSCACAVNTLFSCVHTRLPCGIASRPVSIAPYYVQKSIDMLFEFDNSNWNYNNNKVKLTWFCYWEKKSRIFHTKNVETWQKFIYQMSESNRKRKLYTF